MSSLGRISLRFGFGLIFFFVSEIFKEAFCVKSQYPLFLAYFKGAESTLWVHGYTNMNYQDYVIIVDIFHKLNMDKVFLE